MKLPVLINGLAYTMIPQSLLVEVPLKKDGIIFTIEIIIPFVEQPYYQNHMEVTIEALERLKLNFALLLRIKSIRGH